MGIDASQNRTRVRPLKRKKEENKMSCGKCGKNPKKKATKKAKKKKK
jgi:hypothetical protein